MVLLLGGLGVGANNPHLKREAYYQKFKRAWDLGGFFG
jgi:hypothetical protein